MDAPNTVEGLMTMIAIQKALSEQKTYNLINVPHAEIKDDKGAFLIVSDDEYAKRYPTIKIIHKAEFAKTK